MRWFIAGALLLVSTHAAGGEPPSVEAGKSLKLLSNNVGIFPAAVVEQYPANVREKKKHIIADEEQRAALLAKALMEFDGDPDVVLLQEIWSLPARDRLIKEMAGEYPHVKHPPAIGDGTTEILASGLMLFSKYPLDDYAFKEFTRGIGIDKQARKGIVGVKLTVGGKQVAVFNTHLQAGGKRDPSVKPHQLRECDAFIREFVDGDPEAIAVMAGDFNIRSNEPEAYGAIFSCLTDARDSYEKELGPLTTTTRNEKQPDKRIDYLLTFGDVQAASTIVDPAGETISDHMAVFGTVELE
ncbi:MAG: hypothetical protein DWQ37_13165 [Planctomycetota bacterium]|nr:MAG: hypothetical protein DWQ37_13165 [Planctomycetota bacterium]